MAQNPFDNTQLHNARDFLTLSKLATTEQAGPNLLYFRQYGETPPLTADVPQDLWTPGGSISYLTSAETMDIVSSSVNDAPAGSGLGGVKIWGIDANYNPIDEVVLLNGTTPVVTTQSFLRVYRAVTFNAGNSGTVNDGTISITATTSGTDQSEIPAGVSHSRQSNFTIPAGYTGFVTQIIVTVLRGSGNTTKLGEVTFFQKSFAFGADYTPVRLPSSTVSYTDAEKPLPIVIPEKDDLKLIGTAASNNAVIGCQYDIILMKGNYDLLGTIL